MLIYAHIFPQVTREERLIVKPLYDRYRLVKQMLTRVSITPIIVRLFPLFHMYTYVHARQFYVKVILIFFLISAF